MKLFKVESKRNLNYKVDPNKKCVKYVKSSKEEKFSKHKYQDSIVRADYCKCIISIIFNTNNIEKSIFTINKFIEKASNPEDIQFCIKIDSDNPSFVDRFLKETSNLNCNFVILSSPSGRGFIDLWQWVNFLFKVSSKNSHFVMNISDEMYVDQKNWDSVLEKYINLEADNIFRLRTSVYKNRNYNDLYECAYAPDTTAIYTRKYITIQGNFSPCFGPDNGQQIVAYYLSKINYPNHYQYLRDKVINDISFSGQGTNIGLKEKDLDVRRNLNHQLWLNIFKYKNQLEYYKRAKKIQIEILKNSFPSIIVKDNGKDYQVYLSTYNSENHEIFIRLKLSYSNLSKIKLMLYNLARYDFFKFNTGHEKPRIIGILVTLYFKLFNQFPSTSKNKTKSRLEIFYGKYSFFTGLSFINILKEKNLISKKRSLFEKIIFNEILYPVIHYITVYLSILLFPLIIIIDARNIIKNYEYFMYFINLKFFGKYIRVKSHMFQDDKFDQSKTINIKGD